jgi:nucleoside triphosphate pyrophosphatase
MDPTRPSPRPAKWRCSSLISRQVSRLVLASRSPQRRAILEQLGIEFSVQAADVEELEVGPPHEVALENAFRKASAIAAADGGLVLGVDTVVSLGTRLYGKPADAGEARATLTALAGRRHAVISGVCLIEDGNVRSAAAQTGVQFRALDDGLIDWYLSSGEWRERAGGYAIQGRGAALVAGIEGDFLNVVGLPVATLLELAPGLVGK